MSACVLDVNLGSGRLTTRSVEVPSFDRIATRSFLDVEVVDGPTQDVILTCDDNLLTDIDVSVKGGTLVFDTVGSINLRPSPGCRAQVTMLSLRGAKTHGSGDLRIGGLACDQMDLETFGSGNISYDGQCTQVTVNAMGSGDVRLQGETQTLSMETRGSGDIDASAFVAQHVSAVTRGSGDLQLHALQSVVATSRGSGDIKISGPAPQRQVKSSGSGDISFQ